jgi:hypothetical protein
VEGAKSSEFVEVTLDDEPVPAALIGVAQQVDPKHHVARARFAAGTAERQIDLSEGQHETIRLSVAKAAEPAGPNVPAEVSRAPEQDNQAGNTWQRPTAFAVGGVGIVALGISGVFTLKALSKKSDSEAFCDGSSCHDSKGVDLLDDARSAGNVATIAGVTGLALASAGVVLYFTAPHGTATAFRVSPLAVARGGGLSAGGSF